MGDMSGSKDGTAIEPNVRTDAAASGWHRWGRWVVIAVLAVVIGSRRDPRCVR
jgi:hypothetical protein